MNLKNLLLRRRLRECDHVSCLSIIWELSKRDGKICLDCGAYATRRDDYKFHWNQPWIWRKS